MNSVQIEPSTSVITSNNTDRKHLLSDIHRTARKNQGKQANNNDAKKSRKPKKESKPTQEDQSVRLFKIMQEQIRSRLSCCQPGRELEVLHHTLKPDYNTLWLKCMEVKKDLLIAFQRSYPFVRLEVFGSTVMGIAFKDSDFDFFIELSREPPNTRPASTIGKAMNILKQSGNFTNFVPISHARVPILKCYHMPTGYQCDINFSDSYGILNSPIVARLLTYDARIYVLATILKYWTKVHDCAGKNRISNYAIVWMLLFYLQQLAEPILPPIIEFQKRVHPYFVNGYNFAFDDRLANRTKNQSRSSELLMGFFKFYKTFDFESNVICPLFGKVFRKADILSKSLPEFKAYHGMLEMNPNLTQMQFNKCICIQDPFEITHSIPGAIAHLEFSKILLKFELAAEIIDFELKSEGESTKLLLLIFDAVKFNQYVQEKMPKNDIKQQTAVIRSQNSATSKGTLQIKPTDYHLSIVREILTKQSNGSNAKIENLTINRSWAEHVIEFIGLMLKDIFILKMESTSNNMVNETETPSTSADITSENDENSDNLMKRFVISGNRDVFLGRKQTKKINVNSLNIEMLDSQERFKNTAIEIQLKAAVQLSANMSTFDAITINFEDLIKTKKNNSFKTFFTNFDQNLNNLLKIYFLYKIGTLSRNVS